MNTIENIVEKWDIDHYEQFHIMQFLILPNCFQKVVYCSGVCMWGIVKVSVEPDQPAHIRSLIWLCTDRQLVDEGFKGFCKEGSLCVSFSINMQARLFPQM